MPSLRRLFTRRSATHPAPSKSSPAVNLVSSPEAKGAQTDLPPPPPLGIATHLEVIPWALPRLAGIFRELARRPDQQTMREARFARHCLSRFWLSAPIDQLESLYSGPLGQMYRLMLDGVLPSQPLAVDEAHWRDALQRRLFDNFDQAERLNLVLALMPYFAPGGMKVAEPITNLPRWFLLDYARFCDPGLEQQLRQPVGLLETSTEQAAAPPPPPVPLPVLAQYRGVEALALMEQEEFQQRMMGLINLHRLEPQDEAIVAELSRLRRQMGQLWLDLVPQKLEALYRSSVGELYRQLLASPFSGAPLSDEDRDIRSQLAPLVGDLRRDGALNALLAVLPFFPPGKVELAGDEELIPPWLMEEIQRRHH